jgi:hypothetical protein
MQLPASRAHRFLYFALIVHTPSILQADKHRPCSVVTLLCCCTLSLSTTITNTPDSVMICCCPFCHFYRRQGWRYLSSSRSRSRSRTPSVPPLPPGAPPWEDGETAAAAAATPGANSKQQQKQQQREEELPYLELAKEMFRAGLLPREGQFNSILGMYKLDGR